MDYMFLIYSDAERSAAAAPKEARVAAAWAVLDEAVEKGVFKAANPLPPPNEATTARSVNGKVVWTDGPFAETKEFLGGFWIIDCADEDEARSWASKLCQTVCSSTVEFRPLLAIPPRPEKQPSSDRQFVNA